jgi:hypothetical protein
MFTFGKTHLIFIGIGLSVAVFGSGFLIGQKITKDFYLLEIEKIENSALKTENEYLTKKISIETELKNKVNEVITYEENTKADIERNFDSSMLLLNSVSDGETSTDKVQLPDIATATATIPAGRKTKCHQSDNRNFERLSKRLLEQAKEYDLLKARYNALVKVWKQTEQKLNNFE